MSKKQHYKITVNGKEEEFLASLGPKQPRTDLYVPSMTLLIGCTRTSVPLKKSRSYPVGWVIVFCRLIITKKSERLFAKC